MRALVLVPTYNERENILQLLAEVLQVDQAVHILVIDDGSPDGTGDLVETVARQCDRVYVLHRSGKQGLGTAYLAGFSYALAHHYDCVVEMDANFPTAPWICRACSRRPKGRTWWSVHGTCPAGGRSTGRRSAT